MNQLAVNFTLFSLLLDAHTSKFTVLNSVKDRKWVGEREDNPKSSISYNTEDRPDNWLKYLAAAELNNHFTIKGNQKMEMTDALKRGILFNGKLDAVSGF